MIAVESARAPAAGLPLQAVEIEALYDHNVVVVEFGSNEGDSIFPNQRTSGGISS